MNPRISVCAAVLLLLLALPSSLAVLGSARLTVLPTNGTQCVRGAQSSNIWKWYINRGTPLNYVFTKVTQYDCRSFDYRVGLSFVIRNLASLGGNMCVRTEPCILESGGTYICIARNVTIPTNEPCNQTHLVNYCSFGAACGYLDTIPPAPTYSTTAKLTHIAPATFPYGCNGDIDDSCVTPNEVSVCGNNIVESGEQCDGGACCNYDCTYRSSSTECRPSVGPCDAAEKCTGTSALCPADVYAKPGLLCRESAGICDKPEYCTGVSTSCPPDTFQPSTVACRPAVQGKLCDAPEYCSGTSASCPTVNAVLPNTHVCRASATGCDCDPEERCDGISDQCPADYKTPANTPCKDQKCCGTCDGRGSCVNKRLPICVKLEYDGTATTPRPILDNVRFSVGPQYVQSGYCISVLAGRSYTVAPWPRYPLRYVAMSNPFAYIYPICSTIPPPITFRAACFGAGGPKVAPVQYWSSATAYSTVAGLANELSTQIGNNVLQGFPTIDVSNFNATLFQGWLAGADSSASANLAAAVLNVGSGATTRNAIVLAQGCGRNGDLVPGSISYITLGHLIDDVKAALPLSRVSFCQLTALRNVNNNVGFLLPASEC